jgi:hypothetical protein
MAILFMFYFKLFLGVVMTRQAAYLGRLSQGEG